MPAGVPQSAGGGQNTAAQATVLDRYDPWVFPSAITYSDGSKYEFEGRSTPRIYLSDTGRFILEIYISREITSFPPTAVDVTNGRVLSVTSPRSYYYNLEIEPSGTGNVVVTMPAGRVFTVGTGRPNLSLYSPNNYGGATDRQTFYLDNSAPTLSVSGLPKRFEDTSPIPITFTFSEDVTGFDATDVGVTNAALTGFTGSGASYTATLTPAGTGAVQMEVTQNSAIDVAGNGNQAWSEKHHLDPPKSSNNAFRGSWPHGLAPLWQTRKTWLTLCQCLRRLLLRS